MPTTSLLVAADARVVSGGVADSNYGGFPYLSVSSTTPARYSFAYFNRPFPLGVTILSATLHLYQKGAATGGSRTVTVARTTEAWVESKITWNNRPTVTGATAALTKSDSATNGREWAFDVAALVQEVADGGDWYGFRLSSDNATSMDFYGKESAGQYVPVLTVTYSDAPAQPSQLSPSGGRAVSVARPAMRADFYDPVGSSAVAAIQVQTNTSDSWVSPATDSGEVATTIPEWQLNFDATTGQTRYWRVRIKAESGLWSPWSDSTTFTRTLKPTVTITNPPVSPAEVYESLPTFSHTISGATQKKFQWFITDPIDTGNVLWTSDVQSGTATSYGLPAAESLLMTPGSSYNLILRVWDTVNRQATAGDPAYTEVSRVFAFASSGASTSPAGLTASVVAGEPFVTLDWTRTGTVNSFTITRNGKTIAVVAAADALVSGTAFRYVDRTAPPRTANTYSVAARQGTATSAGATTSTNTRTEPIGVWLYGLGKGDPVAALGTAPGNPARPLSMEASEETAVLRPVGSPDPILITQAVRPHEGQFDGFSKNATDLAAWESLTGKTKRGTTLGLTLVNRALKVQVYNVVTEYADEFQHEQVPVAFDYVGVSK